MKKQWMRITAFLVIFCMLLSPVTMAEEALSETADSNMVQSETVQPAVTADTQEQPDSSQPAAADQAAESGSDAVATALGPTASGAISLPNTSMALDDEFAIQPDATHLIVDRAPGTITLMTGDKTLFADTVSPDCFTFGKAFQQLAVTGVDRQSDHVVVLSVDGTICDRTDNGVEIFDEGTVDASGDAFADGIERSAYTDVQTAMLSVDSVKANGETIDLNTGLKSDVRTVELVLKLAPEGMPYYVMNSAGQKNSLTEFQFGGAFANATVKNVKIRSAKPDTIDLTIETTDAMLQDDTGYISILPQNNCFGLLLETGVKVIQPSLYLNANTNGLVDNPNTTGDPTYTIKVGLNDCKLKDNLTKETLQQALSFDGAFADSQFSVNLNNDQKGFEIKLTKVADYSPNRQTSGTLTVNSGVLVYDDGSSIDHSLTLGLQDDFVPQQYTVDTSGDVKVEGESIFTKLAKNAFIKGGQYLVKNVQSYLNFSLIGDNVVTSFADLIFGKDKDQNQEAIMNEFKKLNDRFDELNTHLDTLFQQKEEKDAFRERKNQIASIYQKADNLYNTYYQHYNDDVLNDLDWVVTQSQSDISDDSFTSSVNEGKWRSIEDSLRLVYYSDTDGDNFGYYDAFVSFSDDLLGKGAIATKDDFYTLNNLQLQYGKVFSYETIEEREKSNEAVNTFYSQGYVVLRTALNYSIESNTAEKETCDATLEELKTALDNATGTEKDAIQKGIVLCSQRSDQLNKKIESSKRNLKRLEENNTAIEQVYQNEKDAISAIRKAHDEDHKIYSYALGKEISTEIHYAHASWFNNNPSNVYDAWNVMKEIKNPLSDDDVTKLLADIKLKGKTVADLFESVQMTLTPYIQKTEVLVPGYGGYFVPSGRYNINQPKIILNNLKQLNDPTKVLGIYKSSNCTHKKAGVFNSGYDHKNLTYYVMNGNIIDYGKTKDIVAAGSNYKALTGNSVALTSYNQNVILLTYAS